MSLSQFKENESILTTQKHCPCVEFLIAESQSGHPRRRCGFHMGQLLHYTLEATDGDDHGEGRHGPPEKLSLAFATADVVIMGWRLERIAENLRDGELLALRALPSRYANLDRTKTYVASIAVESLSKD
ncbi:MAG: hypothetical protein L0Z50_38670 [Verrucomicrobiales bacterium]|nr:hypothetical protein [Verrucomicrobiales bacterium]